jgi:Glycogen recognition site of AMP-activated protein kinase
VMSALPEAAPLPAPAPVRPRSRWVRAWSWVWSPRPITISFRPGYALAAIAALTLLAGRLPAPVQDAGAGQISRAGTPPPVYVQFRLNAAGAHQVELAGSFTGWKPAVPLRETSPGVWTALVPLRPGVHDYAFVVDGRWTADPEAPQVDDSFGGTNSRISLLPPGDAA